jgi:hypothetical protein
LFCFSKLEDWSSGSDNEDPAAPIGGPGKPGNNRMNRVVVLKHMFTLQELEDDPGLALELKDDVREEAETIGTVTNIHLFDVSARATGRCLWPRVASLTMSFQYYRKRRME